MPSPVEEELDSLKQEYSEFQASSRELEAELEKELETERKSFLQLQQKLKGVDDKLAEESKKNSSLLQECSSLQSKCSSLSDKLNEIESRKRALESLNEDLSAQTRILESSNEDLKHKLDNAEEDIVFLQTDIDELKWSKQETEQRLNSELLILQAKLESMNSQPVAMIDASNEKENDDGRLQPMTTTDTEELELEVEELRAKLIEVEQQNLDLSHEVTNMTDELLEHHEKAQDFNQQITKLNQTIEDLNGRIEQLSRPIENKAESLVSTEVNDKINQMERLNAKLITQAADVKEAQDEVIKELEEKILFLSSKASSVENDRNDLLTAIGKTDKWSEIEKKSLEIEISRLTEECKLLKSNLQQSNNTTPEMKNDQNNQKDELQRQREHNTKLLYRLQTVLGNIQVYCRTRPPLESELNQKICIDVLDNSEVACFDNRSESWRSFVYDRVWAPDSTQADVFQDIEPMILSVVDGFNTCLLAYGQTSSGKTYTMNGSHKEKNGQGISHRSLHTIFAALEAKAQRMESGQQAKNKLNELKNNSSDINDTNIESILRGNCVFSYSVNVSMVEIYNEQLRDLLLKGPSLGTATLEIRQAADGTVHAPGLNQVKVNSIDEVMTVFARGSAARATAATNINEHSSRSHLILVVEVTTCVAESSPVKSKLFLVDLAGSERVGKSGCQGLALTEAKYINKSLSALGDVMEALDQKSKHIPYRNSKLTYFLQDSLGGNSRTMMIVTTCPTDYSAEETLFTLQFASRVRNINIGAAKRNFNTKNLEEAVKILKVELGTSHKNNKKMEDQLMELKRENKRLLEKNNEMRIRAFDELKKINSMSTPTQSSKYDKSRSSLENDISKTPKGQSSPLFDESTDNKAKDRQSVSSRASKVPVPHSRSTPESHQRLTLPSTDTNTPSHKDAPSSLVKQSSSRKAHTDTKKTDRADVPESHSNDGIKTTIDLATRRRIAERSAITLQKHKERMEVRRQKQKEVS